MKIKLLQKKIVQDAAFLSSAGYANQFFQFVRGFIVAKLLDPTLFGYLSGARLVLQLTSQMHMGALHGLSRYLSLQRDGKEGYQYRQDVNGGITFILGISAVITLAIIIYTFFVAHKYNPYTIWGVRVFAVVSFVKQCISIYHALFRAEYDFTRIGISQLIIGGGTLVLSVIFIMLFGLYGAIGSFLSANILSLLYLYYKNNNFQLTIDYNPAIIKQFVLVGAPISFFYFNNTVLHALDKIIISNFLDVKQLGYYAIALPFFNLISKVPSSITYIIYPKMLEAYGKGGRDILQTRKYFQAPTLLNSIFVSYSIAILYFFVEFIFAYALPRYESAVPVVKILSLAIYFNCLAAVATRVLVTKKSYKVLFVLQVIAMLSNLALNLVFIHFGAGIQGVAWATGLAYILQSSMLLSLVIREYYDDPFKVVSNYLSLMFPLLLTVLLVVSMESVSFFQFKITHDMWADFFHVMVNSIAFTCVVAPIYFLFGRKIVQEIS